MTTKSKYTALCNDCCRVLTFRSSKAQLKAHAGKKYCVCGSKEICSCGGCLNTIKLLAAGCKDPVQLGFQAGVTVSGWTADQGLRS
jgi:hypothetical protein